MRRFLCAEEMRGERFDGRTRKKGESMFAIALIGLFALYVLISLVVVWVTARFARKRGKRG